MLQRLKSIKILVLGASGVGKTAILMNLKHCKRSANRDTEKMLGVQFFKYKTEINHYPYTFQIWDFKDDPKFDFTYPNFFKGAAGVILIFDLSKPETLLKAKKQLSWVFEHLKHQVPFILVGNKVDLVDDLEAVIDRNELTEYAYSNGGIYIEEYLDDLENFKIALKKLFELIVET